MKPSTQESQAEKHQWKALLKWNLQNNARHLIIKIAATEVYGSTRLPPSGMCKGTRGFRSSDIRKCLMFMAPLERRPPRCRCVKCRRAEYSAPGALICEPTNGLIPAADANGVLQLSLGCADLRQPHDPHSFLVRRVDLNRRPHKPTFARLFPSEACRCFTSCPSHGSLFEFHPGRSATDYSG